MCQRLKQREIEKIIRLTKEGKSLNEISRILNKNKTTIYYHFKKIKGKTFNPVIINSNNEDIIGEFIGLFAGDGSCCKTKDYKYKTFLHFNITEKEFVEDLTMNVLIPLFNKKPMTFIQENRLNLCYYSKNIHTLIYKYLDWDKSSRKTYSVKLKERIFSKDFMVGFTRGNLDSDGHISKKKICFASVSKSLIDNISKFLKALKIKHSIYLYKEKRSNRKDIYHIYISRTNHQKFIKMINPRNTTKYK